MKRWALGLLLAAACSRNEGAITPAEIVVEIDAEPAVRAALTEGTLRIVVEGSSGDLSSDRTTRLDTPITPVEFPARVALVPLKGDETRVFVLTVTAIDGKGRFLAQARMIGGYLPGAVLYSRLVIEDACIDVTTCDAWQTCTSAVCADATVDPTQLSRDPEQPTTWTPQVEDAGAVEVDKCANPDNVCTSDFPCVNRSPDYECSGLFPEWKNVGSVGPYAVKNGIATDTNTGLQWQQNLPATYDGCSGTANAQGDACTHSEARTYCSGLSLGGGGWRLPSAAEAWSLVNFNADSPALDKNVFREIPGGIVFWTSSPYVLQPGAYWRINFGDGTADYEPLKATFGSVRCVR